MMPGLPNPWMIIGVGVAFVGVGLGGFAFGSHVTANTYQLKIDDQEKKAKDAYIALQAHAAQVEHEFTDFKDQVDKEHAQHDAEIAAAYASNQQLIVKLGGLRDAAGRCGGGSTKSGVSKAPADATVAPTGCQLSDGTSQALLELAKRADETAEYAKTAIKWIDKLEHDFAQ